MLLVAGTKTVPGGATEGGNNIPAVIASKIEFVILLTVLLTLIVAFELIGIWTTGFIISWFPTLKYYIFNKSIFILYIF